MRWPLLLVIPLAFLLPGCALGPEEFVVLAVSGDVRGSGPERFPDSLCAPAPFHARYDLDARAIEVAEEVRPAWTPRLIVSERVLVQDPGDESACGPWPILTASRDGTLDWTWRLHDHVVVLPIAARDGVVRVEGRVLAPGEARDVPVAFTWDAPWNATYAYEGSIRIEHRGTWPAAALRTAEPGQGHALWRVDG
jgi:hypothetical protein